MIWMLWDSLEQQASADLKEREDAEAFLRSVLEEHYQQHTACGRAFIELYERDRSQAREWSKLARGYVATRDPAIFRSYRGEDG